MDILVKEHKYMSKKYPTLPNPPITEALIDIRVDPSDDVNLEAVEKYYDIVKDDFPLKSERFEIKSHLEITQGNPTKFSEKQNNIGYLFKTSVKDKVVQSQINGFTFNKLMPYYKWPLFIKEARSLWMEYCQLVKPKKVVRLGVRFINRILIPLPINDIEEYFLTIPKISPKLDLRTNHYLLRFQLSDNKNYKKANVIQTIESPEIIAAHKLLPFIFDIGVYINDSFNSDDPIIFDHLEDLRDFKNSIFFESITKKTEGLFQ